MSMTDTAPMGHNNPPEPTLEEKLKDAATDLLAERTRYDQAIEVWSGRSEVMDDGQEEAATNFIAKANGLVGKFEAMREAHKKPFLEAGRVVDATFTGYKQPLVDSSAHVRALLNGYKAKKLQAARAEQARLAEIARKATAEAKTVEQMADAAKMAVEASAPIEPVRAYTGGGAMSSMKTEWECQLEDLSKVPLQFLMLNEGAVKAWQKSLPKGTIPAQPGLKFVEVVKSIVKGK